MSCPITKALRFASKIVFSKLVVTSAILVIRGSCTWKAEVTEVAPPLVSKELKKRWSHFISKVYETDPLVCPKCSGEMRIISFIDQPES